MPVELASSVAEVLVANTWECNLRCSYCFVDHNHLSAQRSTMSVDLAGRVVDALDQGLANAESICIHFYGGEPLLNLAAMEAMVSRASQLPSGRFTFAITTNGTSLSPEAIGLLGAACFDIILSIDGPAAVHDECRRTAAGAPTHHRVIEFLETVRKRTDCRIRGSAVVRSGWSLQQASQYLSSLPLDAHKAQVIRGQPGHPYELNPAEKRAYLRDLELIGQQVVEDLEAGREPRDDRYSSWILQLLKGSHRESYCGAGASVFGLSPSGEVLPCLLVEREENLLGQIDDDPDVWVQAGKVWREAQPKRSECQSCAAFVHCGGGCPAMMPVCGAAECDLTRKVSEVSTAIYRRFEDRPTKLLALVGVG